MYIKKIIFLEDSDCISSVIKDFSISTDNVTFVSLNPCATYAFEHAGLRYRTILDYCKNHPEYSEECERQGLENFRRIERIATILEEDLQYICTLTTVNPIFSSIYNLKFLLDGLWTIILKLKIIIEREKPDVIYLYTSKPAEVHRKRFAFSNSESVYSEVLLMDGWPIPVEVIRSTASCPAHQDILDNPPRKNTIARWLQRHDLLFNLGIIFKREGLVATGDTFVKSLSLSHKKPILIYNSGYNWDDSLDELYQQGMYPVYRITDESVDEAYIETPGYYNQIIEMCGSHQQLREFDDILGVDVSKFFFHRFAQIVETSIKESILSYRFARDLIQKKKIQCLLLSTRERAMSYAIIQAARDSGIPVVSWQHGGGGYTVWPMIPYIEFYGSDVHFVFSEKVARNYLESSEKVGLSKTPVFFPVGSSSLDNFHKKTMSASQKEKSPGMRKSIVYVTTHYEKNFIFISHPFNPIAIDDHLWDLQKRILNLAKATPEHDFIIKLHSAHTDKEPLKSYINDKNINNVQIISSEKSIPEIIFEADIIVIDHITTGILQILTSNLPIFVYNGISCIDKEAIASLKKRTYVYNDIDTLITDLLRYIPDCNILDPSVNHSDTDFILKYGTDICRHNSAEKAVKKVEELIVDAIQKR